jgi:hypothetical protein
MGPSDLSRYALAIGASAALLVGCGGSQPPIGALGATPQSRTIAQRIDHGSWMLPGAKNLGALLYVSDGSTNNVFVYDFKSGELVGTLTGFSKPMGECVDKSGHVWITNYENRNSTVVEYAHGGTTPIATLSINDYSFGCSIDPKTGDLAVSSEGTDSGGNGALQVFSGASGAPREYPAPSSCPHLWPPGYDDKGNLYVEADIGASSASICELSAGGNGLRLVTFNHSINFPTSVMWDGKYIALGDQNYFKKNGRETTAIFQASPTSSGELSLSGVTVLTNACRRHPGDDLPLPFIVGRTNTPSNRKQGTVVLGQDYPCRRRSSDFAFWHYPFGGNHFKELADGPDDPLGESVSFLPNH